MEVEILKEKVLGKMEECTCDSWMQEFPYP